MSIDTQRSSSQTSSEVTETPLRQLLANRRRTLLALVVAMVIALLCYRPFAGALFLSLGSHSLGIVEAGHPEHLRWAVQQLEVARDFVPNEPLVYRRLAVAALLDGRLNDAVAALEQAKRLEPESLLIDHELLSAIIASGDFERAQALLTATTGLPSDLAAVADVELASGRPREALQLYLQTVELGLPSAPLARVRAAYVAATLGEIARAEELLSASGAPNPAAVVNAVRSGAVFGESSPWGSLLVNGQPQDITNTSLYLFYGEGWYGAESGIGRWFRSPAAILIYSPTVRPVTVQLLSSLITNPATQNGLADRGDIEIALNALPITTQTLQPSVAMSFELLLPEGWSTLTLALETGNIRPSDVIEGSNDSRELSAAVLQIDVVP